MKESTDLVTQDLIVSMQLELESCQLEKRKLQESLKIKEDAIANFNHEILTPTNSIFGLLDLALEKGYPPELSSYLEQIRSACSQLKGIIDNVRAFTDFDGPLVDSDDIEDIDLYDFFEELQRDFFGEATRKNNCLSLAIATDLPLKASLNKNIFKKILVKVLENAIKFTSDGDIQIVLDCCSADNSLQVRVKDNGIGITDEIADKIFDAYVQGDSSSTRQFGGTGLGLTLAQKMLSMIGGKLTLDNKQVGQTEFVIDLPVMFQSIPRLVKYQFADEIKELSTWVCSGQTMLRESMQLTLQHLGMKSVDGGEIVELHSLLQKQGNLAYPQHQIEYLIIHWSDFKEIHMSLRELIISNYKNTRLLFIMDGRFDRAQFYTENELLMNAIHLPLTRYGLFQAFNKVTNMPLNSWKSQLLNLLDHVEQVEQVDPANLDSDEYQSDKVNVLIQSLLGAVSDGNYTSILEILTDLKQAAPEVLDSSMFQQIKNAVDEFDFTKAESLINHLLTKSS